MAFSVTLHEVFDNPYKYRWHRRGGTSWRAVFTLETGDDYVVLMELDDTEAFVDDENAPEHWVMSFGYIASPGNIQIKMRRDVPRREVQRIFATVIAILKEFVQIVKPDTFSFNAADDEPTRIKLYKALHQRIPRVFPDYVIDIPMSSEYGGIQYIARRK